MHELNNPIWHSLTGAHSALGKIGMHAAVYDEGVAPFAALSETTCDAIRELATLVDRRRPLAFFTTVPLSLPGDWEIVERSEAIQLTCQQLIERAPLQHLDILPLCDADVPDMLALTETTRPGPFSAQTIRFGRYIGVRAPHDGALVGMAGHRLKPGAAVEISAVCTADSHRGQGIAQKLVSVLAAEAIAAGITPFMHVRATNKSALAVYEKIGFCYHQTLNLTVACTPAG